MRCLGHCRQLFCSDVCASSGTPSSSAVVPEMNHRLPSCSLNSLRLGSNSAVVLHEAWPGSSTSTTSVSLSTWVFSTVMAVNEETSRRRFVLGNEA
jgi:hypothetical protein